MKYAEDNNLIPYDLAYLQRRPIALCSNNTKSYYNKIVHSIVSIAL